jgi:hypothetical protein
VSAGLAVVSVGSDAHCDTLNKSVDPWLLKFSAIRVARTESELTFGDQMDLISF